MSRERYQPKWKIRRRVSEKSEGVAHRGTGRFSTHPELLFWPSPGPKGDAK